MKIEEARGNMVVRNVKTGASGIMGAIHVPCPVVSVTYPNLGLKYERFEDLDYTKDQVVQDFIRKLPPVSESSTN